MTTQSDRGLSEILSQAHVLCGLVRIGMECHQEAVDLDEMIDRYETRPVPVTAEVSVDDGMVEAAQRAYRASIDEQTNRPPSGCYNSDIAMRLAISAALKAQKGVGT